MIAIWRDNCMSAKTNQCHLDNELPLRPPSQSPLTVRAVSLSLIKQDDEVIECRLTFQVNPQLYQRIETEALFNLKPEVRRPRLALHQWGNGVSLGLHLELLFFLLGLALNRLLNGLVWHGHDFPRHAVSFLFVFIPRFTHSKFSLNWL